MLTSLSIFKQWIQSILRQLLHRPLGKVSLSWILFAGLFQSSALWITYYRVLLTCSVCLLKHCNKPLLQPIKSVNQAFIPSFMHACIPSFIHSCMHACIHSFSHSCIHAFLHWHSINQSTNKSINLSCHATPAKSCYKASQINPEGL